MDQKYLISSVLLLLMGFVLVLLEFLKQKISKPKKSDENVNAGNSKCYAYLPAFAASIIFFLGVISTVSFIICSDIRTLEAFPKVSGTLKTIYHTGRLLFNLIVIQSFVGLVPFGIFSNMLSVIKRRNIILSIACEILLCALLVAQAFIFRDSLLDFIITALEQVFVMMLLSPVLFVPVWLVISIVSLIRNKASRVRKIINIVSICVTSSLLIFVILPLFFTFARGGFSLM